MGSNVIVQTWQEEIVRDGNGEEQLKLRWKAGDVAPETWMDFEIHRWNGDKPERVATGNVNWDVCMNVRHDHALHFCEPEDVDRFARVLRRLYEIAAATIPRWDGPKAPDNATEPR